MKNSITLTILALCLTSCIPNGTEENERKFKEISIDPNNVQKVKLSNIFDTYEFIKLETKDKHYIGNIDKIEKADNRYYVLNSSSSIYIFSDEGLFIKEIYSRGKGPGEYLSLSDIFFDKDKNQFIVNDLNGKKLLYYDYDGNFINEKKTDLFLFSLWKKGDSYIYYCGTHPNDPINSRLLFFDESNNLYQDYFPISENEAWYLYIVDNTNFGRVNDSSIFLYSQNDTIYNISSDIISPRYYINFSGLNIPGNFYDQKFDHIGEFMESLEKQNYAGLIDNYYETDNIILFSYMYSSDLRLVIVIKDTWEIHNIDGFFDDMFNINLFDEITYNNLPIYAFDEGIYFKIESFDFIDKYDSYMDSENNNGEISQELIDLANETKVDDNPILIKFY